jgi:hypothetical protein
MIFLYFEGEELLGTSESESCNGIFSMAMIFSSAFEPNKHILDHQSSSPLEFSQSGPSHAEVWA